MVTWSTAPAELSPLLTAAICSSSNNLDKITRFSQIWDDYHIMKSTIINYLTYWSNSLDKITRFNQIWGNYHITKSTIIDNFTYRIIICNRSNCSRSPDKVTKFSQPLTEACFVSIAFKAIAFRTISCLLFLFQLQ